MKRIFCYILIMLLTTFSLSAAPGGGGWNGYRHFSASVTVSDPDGNPIGGVEVQLLAIIYGSEGDGSDLLWGTTTTNGWVNLSTTVYYEGWEEGHFMSVSISDDRYTVISSSNTSSSVSYTLYPDFDVVLDVDQNGINDEWELPLAEKFCPSFKLHSIESINKWIAPEPVEIMTHTLYWRRFTYPSGHYVDDISLGPTENWNYSDFEAPMAYDDPPGGSIEYLVIPHFEWAGLSGNTPNAWHAAYQDERVNNNFRHTIYAHFFKELDNIVIQYWFFYPFNDGYNNHEGDWEHINVIITNQNPSIAVIDIIDFYFHHCVQTRSPSQCDIEDGTHVKIYVGGSGSTTYPIPNDYAIADGGSYPETGWWDDMKDFQGQSLYDEWVAGLGLYIPYSSFIDGNRNDGRGIVILPEPSKIDYDENPEMSWFKAEVAFGHLVVASPFDWWPFSEVGNHAVGGPYHNIGWNETGQVNKNGHVYESYTQMPHQ